MFQAVGRPNNQELNVNLKGYSRVRRTGGKCECRAAAGETNRQAKKDGENRQDLADRGQIWDFPDVSGACIGSFKHTAWIFEFVSAGDWGPESYASQGMHSALAVHGPPIRPRGLSLPPTLTWTTR